MKLAMLLVSLLFLVTTPMIEAKKSVGCREFTGKKCKKYDDTVSCEDVCQGKKKKCVKKCTKCVEKCADKKKEEQCQKECEDKEAPKPKKCTKKCMKKEQ